MPYKPRKTTFFLCYFRIPWILPIRLSSKTIFRAPFFQNWKLKSRSRIYQKPPFYICEMENRRLVRPGLFEQISLKCSNGCHSTCLGSHSVLLLFFEILFIQMYWPQTVELDLHFGTIRCHPNSIVIYSGNQVQSYRATLIILKKFRN